MNYIKLTNILNVSSDIAAPEQKIATRDWDGITNLARDIAQLKSRQPRKIPAFANNQAS